jgi:hypothetical protein
MATATASERWWTAQKGKASDVTFQYVRRVEQELGDVFERLFRLECLYDPNNPDAERREQDRVTENAIASNVDTVHAVVATTDIRARFMTDGADWKQQRTARRLEWYAEDLSTRYDVLSKCRKAFKESAKKGNGIVKVHTVHDEPRVEHVLVENMVVPNAECADGRTPTQMHQWEYIDADELAARFPDSEDEIQRACKSGNRRRPRVGSLLANDVECLWSYRLPVGKKGRKGYKPGRVLLTISGADLLDEKWEREYFPYAVHIWSDRISSWYGISGAERIMGIQRALNRRNWHIEKGNDNIVSPPTYVRPADANIGAKKNRQNGYVVYRADKPETVQHQAVSGETYANKKDLKSAAQEEFGQSSMVTHGAKPAGLDSGIALREFKDQTTQRYASQEQGFEYLVLWTNYLLIDVCKELGAKAPTVTRRTRFGTTKMRWQDVNLGDVRVQMQAASNLNKTPAGRLQLTIEFAQAGIISTDQARRLMQHPDLESELSLYTAALEDVEHSLDAIADGKVVMPEPFTNLAMAVWRGQNEYLKWSNDGAPEEVLETLRQYVVQSAFLLSQKDAANGNAAGAPGADAGIPAGATPPIPTEAPTGAPPQAAFSNQAMALRAS